MPPRAISSVNGGGFGHRITAALLLLASVATLGTGCGGDDNKNSARKDLGQSAGAGVKASGLIAFRRFLDDAQTQGAVFTIRPDGSGERQLTRPPEATVDDHPVVSADGKRIAFERCSEEEPCHAFVMNADGSNIRRVKASCELKPICDQATPAWSRDGRLAIILASGREKTGDFGGQIQRSEIVALDPDGGNQRSVARIENWQGDLRAPVWSPDGRRIAYEHVWSALSKRSGEQTIRVVSVREGKPHQITPARLAAGDHPDWSPDGEWLIFRTNADTEDPPSRLGIVHPDGTGLKQLRTPGDSVLSASFSPDGKWIVYGAPDAEGSADLRAMHVDGSGNRRITRSPLWDSAPDWGR